VVEILGRERRRRWTDAEKLEILSAIGVNGETLSRVARRYDAPCIVFQAAREMPSLPSGAQFQGMSSSHRDAGQSLALRAPHMDGGGRAREGSSPF
jgi:transposase-like protein